MKILTIDSKKNENFLRKKVGLLDFAKENKKELREIVREMRLAMIEAQGVGLSANQVGISKRFFVAQLPKEEGKAAKFYAIFNPVMVKKSEEKSEMEEGCLSIPGVFGCVERHEKITLAGLDVYGKKIKIKGWGLLARIFQHEVDHLDGVLFTDRAKNVRKLEQIGGQF